jgi:hypothetical protein
MLEADGNMSIYPPPPFPPQGQKSNTQMMCEISSAELN